jgi:UDP-glucose 4-epimerase
MQRPRRIHLRATASFIDCGECVRTVESMTIRRVAVTGAAGFIGCHVVQTLRSNGCVVVGIGRHASEVVDLVDDLTDVGALSGFLEREGVDSLVHCAWNGHPRSSAHDFHGQLHSNVATSAVVGLASGLAGVGQLVFLSSGGAGHVGSREDPPPAYGWAKMAAEGVLTATAASFGTELTVLRPSAVFGPGQDPADRLGAVAVFADKLLRGLALDVFGSLDQSRDFLHVRDLADAVLCCLDQRVGGVFPVGGPEQVTIGSLIRTLEAAVGRAAEVRLVPRSGLDAPVVFLDNSALTRETGWIPKRDLSSSIDEIIDDQERLRREAESTGSDTIAGH